MYCKILVPINGSKDRARIIPMVERLARAGAEVILLAGMPPVRPSVDGARFSGAHRRRDCEAVLSEAVARVIAAFAESENVDLIAIDGHEFTGLAERVKVELVGSRGAVSAIDVKELMVDDLAMVS